MNSADIYRRTLASANDGEVCAWWYLGTTTLEVAGHPEIIVNHVETVMLYRSETLANGGFRVPWWEIGLFRDAITGEIADNWLNPLTGASVPAAKSFEEGPSGFSIRTAGDGVEMFDAVQAFAELDRAEIDITRANGRVTVTQTEIKRRSFPGRDGIPDLAKGEGSRSHTVLQWSAAEQDLQGDAASVPATGVYSLELAAPPWLGLGDRPSRFMVKGLMHKAPLSPPLNALGWADLQQLFPQYFDGDLIKPRWTR